MVRVHSFLVTRSEYFNDYVQVSRKGGLCPQCSVEASAHGSYKAIFVVVVAWLAWLAKARMGQTPKTKASHVTHDPLAGAQNIYSENKESCERGFCINRFGRVLVANGILRSTPATSLCGTGYDV